MIVAVPVALPDFPVMVVDPPWTAVTRPPVLTVATALLPEVKVVVAPLIDPVTLVRYPLP